MFRYSGFALTIDSDLEIPELPRLVSSNGDADVHIRIGAVPPTPAISTIQCEFAMTEGVAAFVVRDGHEVIVHPVAGADPALLRIVLLGKVMAFLLRQRGWLPLHASGVAVGERAALFLGRSGVGKSATAAAFHAAGHAAITDDVAGVREIAGRCVVRPAGTRLRLLEESRDLFEGLNAAPDFQFDKFSFDVGKRHLQRLYGVSRIYVLEYGPALRTERVPVARAAALLDTNSFIKRWRVDREILSFHLNASVTIAGITPVYRLIRPRSLAALPELVSLVEKELLTDD